MKTGISVAATLVLATSALAPAAHADRHYAHYEVTITNITKNIQFTPVLAASHKRSLSLFTLGEPASEELAQVAEGGNIAPLQASLSDSNEVFATAQTEGLLMPGESVSFEIDTPKAQLWKTRLSLASMLLPTNDTLVSLNGVKLPFFGSTTYLANAYDAGSETNDESCAHIPGPRCGGEPFSPDDSGEGYVYPAPGIHGDGDLSISQYGWSGPVARVTVKRMY